MGCKTNLRPGIDIRGDGGYVVAPPSTHRTLRNYEWAPGLAPDSVPLAEMPAWLLEVIRNPQGTDKTDNNVGSIAEGSRNSSLFKVAAAMRGNGAAPAEVEELLKGVNREQCIPPLDESEVKSIAQSVTRYPQGAPPPRLSWKAIRPLPLREVAVPSLTSEMIPEPLREWATDVTHRMQGSLDMLMAPTLVALASVIGRRLAIKPKQHDDWKIVPNLWGGIVAPPSAMKTPIMNEGLKQLRRLDAQAKIEFDAELREYKRRKKEADTSEGEFDEAPPTRRRFILNDSTVEKIGVLLGENPSGFLVFRDELFGLLRTLEKPGRESDRQFYLESFTGDGAFIYDRISRGTIDIPALCLSILGGIQPDRISEYFAATIKNGSGDDGFLSRFQLMVYPPRSTTWELVDCARTFQHAKDWGISSKTSAT